MTRTAVKKTTSVNKLAIDGGKPVRTKPLPWELPGTAFMGKEELDLVTRVVKAASPFRFYGPDLQHMVDQLEGAFRDRLGRKFALGVSSATAGLHIAMAALEIGPGDEVLLAGYMWVSCISAIVRLGAIPKLVDIDDTFCMDPKDLAKKLTPRSKAVLLVHMSGACGRVDEIAQVCRKAGVPLIEDVAQANGGSFRGKRLGSFGSLAVFSFQLNKNMSSGEGGMIVCDDEHLFKRCTAVHDLGYARNAEGRLDPSDQNYWLWGVGSRMSELTGAMALAQVRKLDQITGAMRTSKYKIKDALAGIKGIGFRNIIDPAGDSGPFLITVYDTPDICQRFCQALVAEGISGPKGSMAFVRMQDFGLHLYFNNSSLVHRRSLSASGWPWTMSENAFAKGYKYDRGALPTVDDYAGRAAVLCIASSLTEKDVKDVIKAFQKVAAAIL